MEGIEKWNYNIFTNSFLIQYKVFIQTFRNFFLSHSLAKAMNFPSFLIWLHCESRVYIWKDYKKLYVMYERKLGIELLVRR